MLKFGTVGVDGQRNLWIGLSQRNLDRLPEDPIMFDLDEVFPDGTRPDRVVLVAGPDEKSLADRLRAMGLPIPEVPQPQPGERHVIRSPQHGP